jgi:translocation and assembly module TamA
MPGSGKWRFAVGIGARYYSSFGPIRIDLGVPLNRQKGDGPVAVTVSLGQAF